MRTITSSSASPSPPASTRLGDSAIGRRQYCFAGSVIAALVVGGAVATPFASARLLALPGYMAMFGVAMVTINVLLAALLFSKGVIEQRGDAIRLGAAYLFVCTVFVPLTASFPDSLIPGQLIGIPASPVWLWSFWHTGFGLAIIRYAWFAGQSPPPLSRLSLNIVGVLAATAVATLTATDSLGSLPSVSVAGSTMFAGGAELWLFAVMTISAAALGAVARLGARTPEQLWLTVGMVATCFDVWMTFHGAVRYSVGWYLSKGGSLLTSLAVLISLFHEITRLYSQAAAANAVLSGLARTDGLTELANRRCFDETLDLEWRRARRAHEPLSLVLIDIDHFKAFNDTYGHQRGDQCLQQVGAILARSAQRPADFVGRYGGEEFVMLLPNTDAADALDLADRVRRSIEAMRLPHTNSPHGCVTISIGVATEIPDASDTAAHLLGAADVWLYAAKLAGRNRVVGAPPEDLVLVANARATATG